MNDLQLRQGKARRVKHGTEPLWLRISADLLSRVASGEFADLVPGETAMAAQYGVSRGTIRASLRPLRERGILSAERGRKPRVVLAGDGDNLGAMSSLFSAVEATGMAQASIIHALEIVHDERAAAQLWLAPDAELLRLARIRLADGEVLAFDESWLPAETARPLLEADFSRTALYLELRHRCGITLDGGRETIRAVSAGENDAQRLGVGEGTALLQIERLGLFQGAPVEWRCSLIRGDRYSVVNSFPAGSGGQWPVA